MFYGGHNRRLPRVKLCTYKSEHDKCVLQRNSWKDFAVFFERTGKRIGRIWVGRKLFWSAPGTREKRAWRSRKTPVFGLLKRNGKVVVTVVPNYSKEEPMPFIQEKIPAGSTPAGWPECLRRPHSQRLQALTAEFSIMRMNLCAGNPTSTALNASGVTPNDALQNSRVNYLRL